VAVGCAGLRLSKKSAGPEPRACLHVNGVVLEPARLFADRVGRVVQFLVQEALLVAGQTAAVLRRHVA
jgi:hypothetical protein